MSDTAAALLVIVLAALAMLAGIVYYLVTDKRSAEHADTDALAVADAAGVTPPDGSHDNLHDVDQFRWAEEVIWLTEQYEADEVPIIPGRLPGEGR